MVAILIACTVSVFYFQNKGDQSSSAQNNTPTPTIMAEPTWEVKDTLYKDITITYNLDNNIEKIVVNSVFGNENINPEEIKTITFESTLQNCPENSWDASSEKNGAIKAWVVKNGTTI